MSNIDFIIVGLGNPDKEYENTRHNVGFKAIDYIAKRFDAKINMSKFEGLCGSFNKNEKKILLLKPMTYMNLSGKSVLKAMTFYKIHADKVILIFDDISFEVGKFRIKKKGSHGGQNGVKNIINLSQTENFPRIKIGVGNKPSNLWDLSDWVLSKFSKKELNILEDNFESVYLAVDLIIDGKIDEAMNRYN